MTEQTPHPPHASSGDSHGGHAAPHVNYWAIGAILVVLTIVSAGADLMFGKGGGHGGGGHGAATTHAAPESGGMGLKLAIILVVMAVAVAKATFVIMYFMHVKFEGRWIYAMLLPTIILAMAIPAALLPDIGVHYYSVQTRQSDEYEAAQRAAHPPETHPHPEKPHTEKPHPEAHP